MGIRCTRKRDGRMDGKMKKGDIIILCIAVLVSGIALCFLKHEKQGDSVRVTKNGVTSEYSIYEDRTIECRGENNGFNVIRIENGAVFMVKANCPDQICVKKGTVCKNGEMIICLPNDIFVEVRGGEEKEIDN